MLQDKRNIGNKEIYLRIKHFLSRQNILNNRQIAADEKKNEPMKEKSFVEESVVFTFTYQTNGNHVTES